MLRAAAHGWDIQTLASAAGVSTVDSFREAGFREVGRLDVFRDTQILMGWKHTSGSQKRGLEVEETGGRGAGGPVVRKRVGREVRRLARVVEEAAVEDAVGGH
jgi:hypothetical protein